MFHQALKQPPGGGRPGPAPKTEARHPHQAPGQPPHHPRDAAATDPPKQNQGGGGPRSAAHRRRKSDVAPARQGHRQPPGRRDGATHAAAGGRSTATEKHTPGTPKHHANEEATKGGSRRIHLLREALHHRVVRRKVMHLPGPGHEHAPAAGEAYTALSPVACRYPQAPHIPPSVVSLRLSGGAVCPTFLAVFVRFCAVSAMLLNPPHPHA